MTAGQELALRQLRAIELASPDGLEILDVEKPGDGVYLRVDVSVDCAGIEHRADGLALRERERFRLLIPRDFPFDYPVALTPHTRWAGTPHVQWRLQLCVYAAPTIEWIPADGMYGFMQRLFSWLEHAAAGELDPDDAPLHPPVTYTKAGAPLVIARANTPAVGLDPWLGYARLEHPTDKRYDVVEWIDDFDDNGELVEPPTNAAAVLLTPSSLDFEYPETINDLLRALVDRGMTFRDLLLHLGWVAAFREPDEPLLVLLGTAMRRGIDGSPLQHLTAWRIPASYAKKLTDAIGRDSENPTRRELGEQALNEVIDWIVTAEVEWCSVREDRPEVVERRDSQSPVHGFAGRRVAIWGCGALGGPIAECVVRAGASEVILYDYATVHPGVIVRQPFLDQDIGDAKARVLADRLGRIYPSTPVGAHVQDITTGPLSRANWHDEADIVIDATASAAVRSKLERVRRLHPQDVTVITAIIGHTAEHGVITIAGSTYTGAGADCLRATKLACARSPRLRGFLHEFWPDPPRTDLFQPEPGCSSPTFRGSGAEAVSLAATLLTAAAAELERANNAAAVAHLVALPTAKHDGARTARLELLPAVVLDSSDHNLDVRVSDAATRQIAAAIESARRRLGPDHETGGVLFGERDDAAGVIWIDEATPPPPDSQESPELFLCGTAGVQKLDHDKRTRTSRTVSFLGMWHTHPRQSSDFSRRDLRGMLELLDASESRAARGIIVIVGWAATRPDLSAYVFEREELRADQATITPHHRVDVPKRGARTPDIGLALSGGGSRAIAFHLGCLRALHDRGVLDRVRVISGVSGGSVMTGLWAYSNDTFDEFDARVTELLRRGLARDIARQALFSTRTPQAVASSLLALARLAPRRVNRTDALRAVLAKRVCGDAPINSQRRSDIATVINATDLCTGSAFRFGSLESGTWRHGTIIDNDIDVATAIAASAAYPVLLPALDRRWEFVRRNGEREHHRVVLSDGGIFDNLGISCLLPGRLETFSTNVYTDVDYVIACDAGQGLFGSRTPVFWPSRMKRAFETTHRKVQDAGRAGLHHAQEAGDIRGFLLPYLGQQDASLIDPPADLVPRAEVIDYPTNFSAMSQPALDRISKRGEQLTRAALDAYLPDL